MSAARLLGWPQEVVSSIFGRPSPSANAFRRSAFQRLIKQGWVDPIRTLHPREPKFSFWHYMRNRWQRDAGLRLDFLLLSPKASRKLRAADVDRWVRGEHDASDHAPVWIELKD